MKKRALAVIAFAMVPAVLWLVAQSLQPTVALPQIFPGGAVLYIEAKDLASLLRDWHSSAEKKLWRASANYQVFSRTVLIGRLTEAQSEFSDAAGFLPEMSFADSVAGGQTALAIYDIGNLEFLYVTRLDLSQATKTVLFRNRSSYETRNSGGHEYLVRTNGKRTVAFASVNGLLMLATRESLVSGALYLLAQRGGAAISAEAWYREATAVAARQGDLRMVLNMPGLLQSTYFRSYWLHRNASELRPFSAGIVDLYRESGTVREERSFLRPSPAESMMEREAAVRQLAALVPQDEGFFRVWASSSNAEAATLIRSKIVSPGPQTSAEVRTAGVAESADVRAGDPSDLETSIDQPPLDMPADDQMLGLNRLIEGNEVQAIAHIQSSRNGSDGVLVNNETAIAMHGARDWADVRLPNAEVHRSGRLLIIANRPEILKRVTARIGAPPAQEAASYIARYQHARELGPFERMMRMVDLGSTRPESVFNSGVTGQPEFFSGNVTSLGRTLERLHSVSVQSRDDGTRVQHQVLYRLR
ncbi:MAG TPA: hypothetical protein VEQ63_15670 [Bryobacteraceae bacterium]|nr:hypothetical protein [Bryobacteraceae bacterium]